MDTVDKISYVIEKASKANIPLIALFPYTPNKKKDLMGTEALNENNLVCTALRVIKKNFKDLGVMCDVALDPYTSHGHDGILKNNDVENDQTVQILKKQSKKTKTRPRVEGGVVGGEAPPPRRNHKEKKKENQKNVGGGG